MKKLRVSKEEADLIEAQARAANSLLNHKQFAFIMEYLNNALNYVESSILNNTIKDVDEVVPVTEKITHVFKTPKKIQIDELVGQYKFIKKLLADLEGYAQLKKDLDKEVENKRVVLDG